MWYPIIFFNPWLRATWSYVFIMDLKKGSQVKRQVKAKKEASKVG